MPQTPHIERHFTAGEVVRDVVIGMSDGLTVPFALAAGLSGAVDNSHIVVVAGLAEIAASYVCGGIIPLAPYMALHSSRMALVWSVVVTLVALGVFGYIKGRFTGSRPGRSASQTIVIGGLAAGAAFLLAKLIS